MFTATAVARGERVEGFLQRWEQASRRPRLPDCLASQLVLQTEWLQVIRRDPRLPVQHLRQDWPAAQAQQLFRGLYAEFEPRARAAAADLDVVPDEDVGRR